MTPHAKAYLRGMGFSIGDFMPCEVCGAEAVDIHHIRGRVGSLRTDINNLIALCRTCHAAAHSSAISKEYLDKLVEKRGHRAH